MKFISTFILAILIFSTLAKKEKSCETFQQCAENCLKQPELKSRFFSNVDRFLDLTGIEIPNSATLSPETQQGVDDFLSGDAFNSRRG